VGQAQIRCHESEKAGGMGLEKLCLFALFRPFGLLAPLFYTKTAYAAFGVTVL
jgi:hypothetical protein